MADTISTLTTDIQVTFPDLVTATAERYFNMVHNMVLTELGIRVTTRDISLTAGTREYTLNEADIQIEKAYYVRSSADNDHVALEGVTTDYLDLVDPQWRERDTQGTPWRFYVSSTVSSNNDIKKVGFDPIPDTTTSGGYPIVRLHVVQNVTLTSTDTVPLELSCSQVYLDGGRWLHCKNTGRKDEAEYWRNQFRLAMDYEKMYHRNRIRNHPDSFRLGWVKGARVI